MKSYVMREELSAAAKADLQAYPELLQQLLFHRGIKSAGEAEAFLNPNWLTHVHDPFLMKDMKKAVERVLRAIRDNEHIVIYTDYDADGIPAGVIFHDFFKKIGFSNFENYFPHRYEEGYGLNIGAIEKFAGPDVPPAERATLLITADCGIADVEPVKRANELGIDVIITDHHVAQKEIPAAYAILNPKQPGCTYPYNMLCGSGVVFKFIQAILRAPESVPKLDATAKERLEKWLLDMVGLATMADMVPLKGENRVFAYYGLTVLRKSPRLGLMKLFRKIKVDQRNLSEDDIGFMLVPRINAASRMGLPIEAFQLLTAANDDDADRMSDYLNRINDERKGFAAAIVKEAKKHANERLKKGDKKSDKKNTATAQGRILVIGNPDWRPPLLGPAASTIADTYKTCAFLWGRADGELIKGSCRSDGSVNLVALMEALPKGFLAGFGGHRAAGGFSISNENIHTLEEELEKAYDKVYSPAQGNMPVSAPVYLDKKMSLDDVNWNVYRLIAKLAPFGESNPKPAFLFEGVTVSDVRQFGKQKNHLELRFERADGSMVTAIGFFMTDESLTVRPEKSKKLNLIASMEKSTFRNYPELRLRIIDGY